MAAVRRTLLASSCLGLVGLLAAPESVHAEGNCTTIDVDFLPAAQAGNPFAPQIVAWIEDAKGVYVETMFITAQTGTFGIGNRPGRFDFNSGPNWPYGRRITTFPVWAHRHGLTWDQVVFQNGDEDNLSHPFNESSSEIHYCRPLQREEPEWDAYSCATTVFTDKGAFDTTTKSVYPPRADVDAKVQDDAVVGMYDLLNPFDAVSQSTPQPGSLAAFTYPVPETLPFGNYVMFVEVSREFDNNDSYNETVFPAPTGIPWTDYGQPYRGQPSVVYRVPFTIDPSDETSASTSEYVGYGDPTGETGVLNAPDATITTNVAGSGANRLQMIAVDGMTFRVRLFARPQFDFVPPAAPAQVEVADVTSNRVTLSFVAPGDDGMAGTVKQYEARYAIGNAMDETSFGDATLISAPIKPISGGQLQTATIEGLLPETTYTVGIRAVDDCRNDGQLTVITFTTPEREVGDVDACFVATAAYGSLMAGEVDNLRRFRDQMMRKSAFGELAVEAYYTFGPALAGLVGESELLRATSRQVLAPVVGKVRGLKVE
jgi:hypothetical protein